MLNGKNAPVRSKRRDALITRTQTRRTSTGRTGIGNESRILANTTIQPDVARVLLNSIDSFACTAVYARPMETSRDHPRFPDSLRRSVAGREQRLNNKFLSRPR